MIKDLPEEDVVFVSALIVDVCRQKISCSEALISLEDRLALSASHQWKGLPSESRVNDTLDAVYQWYEKLSLKLSRLENQPALHQGQANISKIGYQWYKGYLDAVFSDDYEKVVFKILSVMLLLNAKNASRNLKVNVKNFKEFFPFAIQYLVECPKQDDRSALLGFFAVDAGKECKQEIALHLASALESFYEKSKPAPQVLVGLSCVLGCSLGPIVEKHPERFAEDLVSFISSVKSGLISGVGLKVAEKQLSEYAQGFLHQDSFELQRQGFAILGWLETRRHKMPSVSLTDKGRFYLVYDNASVPVIFSVLDSKEKRAALVKQVSSLQKPQTGKPKNFAEGIAEGKKTKTPQQVLRQLLEQSTALNGLSLLHCMMYFSEEDFPGCDYEDVRGFTKVLVNVILGRSADQAIDVMALESVLRQKMNFKAVEEVQRLDAGETAVSGTSSLVDGVSVMDLLLAKRNDLFATVFNDLTQKNHVLPFFQEKNFLDIASKTRPALLNDEAESKRILEKSAPYVDLVLYVNQNVHKQPEASSTGVESRKNEVLTEKRLKEPLPSGERWKRACGVKEKINLSQAKPSFVKRLLKRFKVFFRRIKRGLLKICSFMGSLRVCFLPVFKPKQPSGNDARNLDSQSSAEVENVLRVQPEQDLSAAAQEKTEKVEGQGGNWEADGAVKEKLGSGDVAREPEGRKSGAAQEMGAPNVSLKKSQLGNLVDKGSGLSNG